MARGQNHKNVEEMRNITCDMLSILVALDIYMLGGISFPLLGY